MAWNGSGQFNRTNGVNSGSDTWENDRDAGAEILASRHDAHDEDIATGLENCLTRDGQNTPSNDLPMATYKHTNVGAASAITQYARVDQIQKSSFLFGGTGGTSTAYTLSLAIAPSAYAAGLTILVQFHTANGATPSIKVNGLGATSLLSAPATPVTLAYFKANQFYLLVHDGSTGFYVVGF